MTETQTNHPDTAQLLEQMEEQAALAEKIEKEAGVPHITAFVMAGDELSAQRRYQMVVEGVMPAEAAVNLTGSYARLGMAMRLVEEGRLTEAWLFDNLPQLWRSADPDDTSPIYLALWRKARTHNGGAYLRDGRSLPKGKFLTVFRGQMPTDDLGIAWTTNPKIAQKFATGAGLRVPVQGGIVLRGVVQREHVLAYLTKRGESEVVVDPKHVTLMR